MHVWYNCVHSNSSPFSLFQGQQTAIELATKKNHQDIVRMLTAHLNLVVPSTEQESKGE